jgi:hypothetical protein
MFKSRILPLLLSLGFAFSAHSLYAQAKINSPYSRLGLGNFTLSDFHHIRTMGGLSAGYNSPIGYSLQNPASLGFLQNTAFDGGFQSRLSSYTEEGEKTNLWSGNLDYISLGFTFNNPINEALTEKTLSNFSWGSSISLIPLTQVGYNISDVENLSEVGNVLREYQGSGGTSALRWGIGARLGSLALGLNADFMFGQITGTRRVTLQDLPGSFTNVAQNRYTMRGFLPGFGAQYRWVLEKNADKVNVRDRKVLTFGAYGKLASNFTVSSDSLVFRTNTTLQARDTLSLSLGSESNNNTLPLQLGMGFVYEHVGKIRFGADFRYAQWSNFASDAIVANYKNTLGLGLGLEYIPDGNAYGNYLKTIRYRASLSYDRDPREFNGSQITNFSAQAGIGLPIYVNRQLSLVNLGLEVGRFANDLLLSENFFRINLSFTLTDNLWFFKRRFN